MQDTGYRLQETKKLIDISWIMLRESWILNDALC